MQGNRQVARAGLLMSAAAALCRLVSLGKEAMVAAVFGAGLVIDAYSLAIAVPALGMSLFVNAVRRAFLTRYPRYEALGAASAQSFANQFISGLVAVSVLVAVLATLLLKPAWPHLIRLLEPMGPHVASGDRQAVIQASLALLVPAAWLIVPAAAIAGLTALLNSRHKFSRPQLTAVMPTLCVIGVVLIGGRSWGAFGLMAALLAGSALQALILAVMVFSGGHRLRWELDIDSQAFLDLWKFTLPIIAIDLVAQGNVFVDLSMATSLAAGKVSILKWGALMKDAVSGTLVASLLVILLPHFSRQVARGATEELRHTCAQVLRYGALALFPISALLVVCGPAAGSHVTLGQLNPQAATGIVVCLAAYGLGLFADLASSGLFQALMALGSWRAMILLVLFSSFIPNIMFNWLLIERFGEVGLAVSTSLVGYTTLVCNYLVLRRAIGVADELRNLKVVGGALAAAVIMSAAGFGALKLLEGPLSGSVGNDLLRAAIAAVAASTVYLFLMLIYPGSDDAKTVLAIFRDKLPAFRGTRSHDG